MRQRSITWPALLILIGLFFLLNNIRPDLVNWARVADYWPFLLIAAGIIGLIEVLYYAARGTAPPPRPFNGGLIFWVVVICFFLAVFGRNGDFRLAGFNNDGIGFFGADYDYDVNEARPAEGVTRIVLQDVRGNLSVKGGDSQQVQITGRQSIRAFSRNAADRANSNNQIHLERNGEEMVVRADQFGAGPRLAQVSADLEIAVPKGVSVESRGRTGEIEVDDMDGSVDVAAGRGDVSLNHIGKDVRIDSTRGGDIHAADVTGGVELDGRGGDVQLENIAGPVSVKGDFSGTLEFRMIAQPLDYTSSRTEFHVEAIPGSVTMDLGNLKIANVVGPVRFQSGTRDIQVTDATELVDLKVDRGDIEFTATRAPLPRVDVHTRDGNVSLTLPGDAGFQLSGSAGRGEITSGFGSTLRIDSSGHSATVSGQNGQGPQINAVTDRGDISLKKTT